MKNEGRLLTSSFTSSFTSAHFCILPNGSFGRRPDRAGDGAETRRSPLWNGSALRARNRGRKRTHAGDRPHGRDRPLVSRDSVKVHAIQLFVAISTVHWIQPVCCCDNLDRTCYRSMSYGLVTGGKPVVTIPARPSPPARGPAGKRRGASSKTLRHESQQPTSRRQRRTNELKSFIFVLLRRSVRRRGIRPGLADGNVDRHGATDRTGTALPGVTVTATSPSQIASQGRRFGRQRRVHHPWAFPGHVQGQLRPLGDAVGRPETSTFRSVRRPASTPPCRWRRRPRTIVVTGRDPDGARDHDGRREHHQGAGGIAPGGPHPDPASPRSPARVTDRTPGRGPAVDHGGHGVRQLVPDQRRQRAGPDLSVRRTTSSSRTRSWRRRF